MNRKRWTLGGLMVLIAIAAVVLAIYVRMPRPDPYPERSAWQALSERRAATASNAASKAPAASPTGGRVAP